VDRIEIPKDAAYIIKKLHDNGFEGHIVGGCVRDSIMGITPHDYDITTSAKPEEIKEIFDHTFDTGIQHGTITVVINKENYEVTTFRIDGDYEDCRHPKEVSFTRDIHEDLLRRDFTMNAIAYNHYDGFTDIFGGTEDINNKIIRGVGDAGERFREDALRMLRAVRFSAQLGFEIEEKTKDALIGNAHLIKNISAERIREEMTKLLISKYGEKVPLLWQTGLLSFISPVLDESIKGKEDLLRDELHSSVKIPSVLFAILMQFVSDKDIKKELAFYKFDNKTLNHILCLHSIRDKKIVSDEYEIRKLVSVIGVENTEYFFEMKIAMGAENAKEGYDIFKKVCKNNDCMSLKDMNFTGKDLISMGIKPGKEMGEILNKLLDIVLKNPELNDYERLSQTVKENFINNI